MSKINWSTKDISDLTHKIIIVTGGNSGLGFQSVKEFVAKGAIVIMACRSIDKGEIAKKEILDMFPKAQIHVSKLCLDDLQSIKDFAITFKEKYKQLDILLNNAGIMMPPYQLTKDGFESQIGTNHLGHFALTGLLLEVLKNTPFSRVVNVSSIAHKNGRIDFDNLLYTNGIGYSPMKVYSRSKLCNLLFTFELQRYFEKNKINSISVAAHPGVSETNLFKDLVPASVVKLFKPLLNLMMQPASMGALPQLRACTDKQVKGADYYGPDGFREMKGYPVLTQTKPQALDVVSAKKLWDASEKLTGVIYP